MRSCAALRIGDNVTFNAGCQIISRESITIGNNCHFGCNVIIIDNDHCFSTKEGYLPGFTTNKIRIGNNCLVGADTIILKGVTIGDNCLIGAGSVITKDIASHSIVIQKRETVIIQNTK